MYMQAGSFPETYNDLEGLTLKYEWLIFIEKALKIGSVSWLLSSAFIQKKALENEDQNTQHEAPKSQKQILNYVFKVQLQDLLQG